MPTHHEPAKKEEKQPDPDTAMKTDAPQEAAGNLTIKGVPAEDKRLFQTDSDTKEWLTEDEAREKGFYWKPDEEEAENGGSKGKKR